MERRIRTLLEMDETEAKAFFMRSKSYCTLPLPIPFNFDNVLTFVANKIGKQDYSSWLKDPKINPSSCDQCSYKIQIAKNSSIAYRTITLVNPYLYYLLVREMTKEESWKRIIKRMEELSVPWIERCAIPGVPTDDGSRNTEVGEQILNWWELFEQRSIELSLEHRYMLCADIADCYPSIYTHSIVWALHGRGQAKLSATGDKQAKKNTKLGDEIDKCIRGMQSGETLGIPQGSTIFDFIAEIILAYADHLLESELKKQGVVDIRVLRYRDDYRIFSNSLDDLNKVSTLLHQVLGTLHFNLNASKTFISDDPLNDVFKKDKITLIKRGLDLRDYGKRSIQKQLLVIRDFSLEYPNSGSIGRLLRYATDRIKSEHDKKEGGFFGENLQILIVLVVDILMKNPKYTPTLVIMLGYLLNKLEEEKKRGVLSQVRNRVKQLPQVSHIEIWMTYLLLRQKYEISEGTFSEPLCSFLKKRGQDLWDITWLKDEYTKGFPLYSICDPYWLKSASPSIPIEETELFKNSY